MVHGSIYTGAADLNGSSCLHPSVKAHQVGDVKGLSKKLKVAQHLRQQPQLSVFRLDMTTSNDGRTNPLPLHDLNLRETASPVSCLRAQSFVGRKGGACYMLICVGCNLPSGMRAPHLLVAAEQPVVI